MISKITRSDVTVKEDGENTDLAWRPDSSIIVVTVKDLNHEKHAWSFNLHRNLVRFSFRLILAFFTFTTWWVLAAGVAVPTTLAKS